MALWSGIPLIARSVSHNGIGNNGDIGAQITVRGSGNNTTDTGYIATVSHNTMVNSAGVNDKGIFVDADVYPTAINKLFISANDTDATTAQDVENAITVVTSDAQAGGVDQATFDALEQDVVSNTAAVATNTTQLANRLKLDTAQTLSSGWLTIQKTNDDAALWLTRSGSTTLQLQARNGYGRFRYSGAKFDLWSSGRYKMDGSHLQLPMNASAPVDNAANCQGGLWVDTSGRPHVLKFHDGTAWKEVSLS